MVFFTNTAVRNSYPKCYCNYNLCSLEEYLNIKVAGYDVMVTWLNDLIRVKVGLCGFPLDYRTQSQHAPTDHVTPITSHSREAEHWILPQPSPSLTSITINVRSVVSRYPISWHLHSPMSFLSLELVILISAFWDMTPCSPVKVNGSFGGKSASIFMFEFQFTDCFMLVCCLTYSSTMKMEATCSSEMLLAFNGVRGVIYQNVELFVTTAVITSNPTIYHLYVYTLRFH
jgi:hypothetical protein